MLGSSQILSDMKTPFMSKDDVSLGNESWFTTTIYSETGKVKIHMPNQNKFWYIIRIAEGSISFTQ